MKKAVQWQRRRSMGQVFDAQCKCGFKQKDIWTGCGIAMDYLQVAGPCKTCRKIVMVSLKMPIEDEDIPPKCICPKCKNQFQPYQEIDDYDQCTYKKKVIFECPKCGKKELNFKCTVMWD
jgi:hypothetical protein